MVRGDRRRFVTQFLGMAAPMLAACFPFCAVTFGLFHLRLDLFTIGALFALALAAVMTAAMALSMRYAMGHSRKCTIEMSALMVLPLVVVVPYGQGLVSGASLCPLICTGMIGLMLADMLFRPGMYGRPFSG